MVLFILNRRRYCHGIPPVIFRCPTFRAPPGAYRPTAMQQLAHHVLTHIDAATPGGIHHFRRSPTGARLLLDALFAIFCVLTLTYLAFRM